MGNQEEDEKPTKRRKVDPSLEVNRVRFASYLLFLAPLPPSLAPFASRFSCSPLDSMFWLRDDDNISA